MYGYGGSKNASIVEKRLEEELIQILVYRTTSSYTIYHHQEVPVCQVLLECF